MKSEFLEKLEKLDKVIDEVIPEDKEHFYNKKMVNTRKRAKGLVKKISQLNPEKDKIEIQNLLSSINGIFSILSTDAKRKEYQTLYRVFEEVNPAWIPFDKVQMKIINKEKIKPKEWLIVAKKMLESMLRGDVDIELAAPCTDLLMFPMAQNAGIKINKKISELFWDIEGLSGPGGSTNINDEETKKQIKKLLKKTNKLLKEYT